MQQNATYTEPSTPVKPYKDVAFDQYVSFCALGGLITSDDGLLSKMTLNDFCEQFGVHRATAYRWKHNTPNFGEKVRQRREELFPLSRESAMWNRLYLIGMESTDLRAAVEAIKILLGHFSELRLPARRQPQSANSGASWVELIQKYQNEGLIDNDTPGRA